MTFKADANLADLVEICMLPALKENLDQLRLEPEHFGNYRAHLKAHLPILYDLLQSTEDTWLNGADPAQKQLRANLVLLLCELTAVKDILELEIRDKFVLDNANKLLNKLSQRLDSDVQAQIIKYYEEKLHKDCWKRQLGATHGFIRYLECQYSASDASMSTNMMTFTLAVGLNVRECYEILYKELGVRIFLLMLTHNDATKLQDLNIHGVIYDDVFRDTYNMDGHTLEGKKAVWNCLCLCLDHFTLMDRFVWNQCDDMLERLLHIITLSSGAETSICLLPFITKLCYHFSINRNEIETKLADDLTQSEALTECREVCMALNSYTSYRWAKSILQMLVLETEKLLQGIEICCSMLLEMLRCYLVCILPIPLQVIRMHLHEFFYKFPSSLMESLAVHSFEPRITMLVRQFIYTFVFQLKNGSYTNLPDDLQKFLIAFESLKLMN
ncbi:uncharacterized protein LOC115620801 isoform X1 [Scaptodrosophila lebanonensis]|uniref:Uncharacterized protein LOC115620801 isoform X1 n=1 Tax=Drosophila lebanonensis TaxID=7225 RepID=A0A6J2T247_DROLE|nr:uncharacterized protein LOC115620801 isoform X1 [Scaptodrosophila lebanonensis]